MKSEFNQYILNHDWRQMQLTLRVRALEQQNDLLATQLLRLKKRNHVDALATGLTPDQLDSLIKCVSAIKKKRTETFSI